MIRAVLVLLAYTFVPALELRFSIPYGLYNYRETLGPGMVVAVCLVANTLLAPLVWVFVDRCMVVFLRIGWIKRFWDLVVLRSRSRLEPYVERWGTLGLALFIGVPLPGSGVYSGALGAYLLGFNFRRYMLAAALGVLIAGGAVTLIVVTGTTTLELFLKR